MKYLVTGFEPFGGGDYNPTQEAVQELRKMWTGPEELIAEVMPVEFKLAQSRVKELIEENRPDVVLCCGLNAQIDTPVLERIAHNLMDASIADNSGYRPEKTPVEEGSAEILRSTLPVDEVVKKLNDNGISLGVSDDAGRYVCNTTLYRVLHTIQGSKVKAAFLHIPDDPERRRSHADAELISRIIREAGISDTGISCVRGA